MDNSVVGRGVVVVGSANMDVIGRVPHLPQEGETVLGTALLHAPGGKGANQAVAAARAGSLVRFVGRVGDDEYGRVVVESLQNSGTLTDCVRIDNNDRTGVALILVDDAGSNCIAVIPGANGRLSTKDIDIARDVIADSAVLILQLEIPFETVLHAAALGKAAGATVILNAAPARSLEPSFLRLFDVVVANREEVSHLSWLGKPVETAAAARLLVDGGVSAVIVTLGAEGAVVVTADAESGIPVIPVKAVDTTGAGDAFVGNFGHAVSLDMSLVEAARFAGAAAALSVQRAGAQPSMPDGNETKRLLQRYSEP